MDGRSAVTALPAHDGGGLAGEGGELHLTIDMLGEILGERGLACARIAEQAENLRGVLRAGLGFEPIANGVERLVLNGSELRHAGQVIADMAREGKNGR